MNTDNSPRVRLELVRRQFFLRVEGHGRLAVILIFTSLAMVAAIAGALLVA